jgi:hypothetical protein
VRLVNGYRKNQGAVVDFANGNYDGVTPLFKTRTMYQSRQFADRNRAYSDCMYLSRVSRDSHLKDFCSLMLGRSIRLVPVRPIEGQS